jgi:hypothetical protein
VKESNFQTALDELRDDLQIQSIASVLRVL